MKTTAFVSAALTAIVAASAYYSDGASTGEWIVNALVLSAAVYFTASQVRSPDAQFGTAAIYLSAVAFASVVSRLLNMAFDQADSSVLDAADMIVGLALGWLITELVGIKSTSTNGRNEADAE